MTQPMVHIVDDEASIRRSVSFLLRTAGYAVETFESGLAFLENAANRDHCCILLDVRMPKMDGLQVQQALNERGVTTPVIVLTGHGDIPIAVRAMRAGAFDFLEKPFETETLLQTIRQAIDQAENTAQKALRAEQASQLIAGLTAREQEVLRGLAIGHPNKTIAYDLGISTRTVEAHRANLMVKLDVRNLSDVLRIAFTAGLGES